MPEQYQAAKKKIIEDIRKENYEGVMQYAPDRDCYIDGVCGRRRCEAVLNSLDQIGEEFGGFEGLSLVEEYAEAELIPYTAFNILNYSSDLSIAAALWILDDLYDNGNLLKAKVLFPRTDASYLPIDFHHPLYSNELIDGVVELLEDVYVCDEIANSSPLSEELQRLFSLLSPERVEAACRLFVGQQLDYDERLLRVEAFLMRRIRQLGANAGDWTDRAFAATQASGSVRHAEIVREKQDADKIIELHEILDLAKFNFTKYLRMDRPELKKIFKGREAADACLGFEIADPYETCFAYIYLLATNNDAAWLFGSGCSLCMMAQDMLPWYVDTEEMGDEELDRLYSPMSVNYNGWKSREAGHKVDYFHTKVGDRNLAQIVYGMSRSVVPNGAYPFDEERSRLIESGLDEMTAAEVTRSAEMLFLSGYREEPLYRCLIDRWLSSGFDDLDLDDDEDAGQTNLDEEIQRLRRENKSLKAALAETAKESGQALNEAEKELKSLRREHRELADLRELLFNRENDSEERKDEQREAVGWPYETKKRIVVFGGHDTFLKAIRNMLPQVKYVDAAQYSFDPNIIRHADMVWIQNNRMSHSQYWSIVRIAKQYGVQLRYFAYASAEKCALQVVEEDG